MTSPLSYTTALKLASDLRKSGRTVGLTHGAFDLMHYGHLHFLRKSKLSCDHLIVAVESDENIASYKSYKRPVFDQTTRLEILTELECVDSVFLFDKPVVEESYATMYRDLSPDFVSHGQAFDWDGIRKVTDDLGIELKRFLNPYTSTTEIIQNVLKRYESMKREGELKPKESVDISER